MAAVFLWILFSIFVGIAGKKRKLGGTTAFMCSLLLSPLVGFLAVILSDELNAAKPTPVQSQSVADELIKLKALYDDDTLTRTQYDAQKARLLGEASPASQTDAG